jgi:hypothetical protein
LQICINTEEDLKAKSLRAPTVSKRAEAREGTGLKTMTAHNLEHVINGEGCKMKSLFWNPLEVPSIAWRDLLLKLSAVSAIKAADEEAMLMSSNKRKRKTSPRLSVPCCAFTMMQSDGDDHNAGELGRAVVISDTEDDDDDDRESKIREAKKKGAAPAYVGNGKNRAKEEACGGCASDEDEDEDDGSSILNTIANYDVEEDDEEEEEEDEGADGRSDASYASSAA